ncbi:TetR/AcrR family transcriptional regulator [Achromobacter pestifer]|uniref:HTH tetR-type domain-containing protein n=1 Tax=Achromobacter pestifer TaxID=1353889 RepID=A0A6S6YPV3_9BURK|nr:TetR/AcrR family transcriptional regulator [Achromobacter pestifer]CAB3627827.1 hypothetical protein LMG3431_00610 [Achromobacter pestifer]
MPTPAKASPPTTKPSSRVPASRGKESAVALIATAQRLFAERGIDAVSFREIAREAGQKNNSALAYHFGSKEALIQAILDAGMQEVNVLRNDYVDQLYTSGRYTDLRALVEALVWPLAMKLVTEKKNTYNRFLAATQLHPDIDLGASSAEVDRGFRRVFELVEVALPNVPGPILRQRWLAIISFMMFALADYERLSARRSKSGQSFDIHRAIENLIDMLRGALAAPISEEVANRITKPIPPSGKLVIDG